MVDLKLFDEDVPDPTDFPQSAPGLMQLDDALRCRICRELFQAPVTVNCPSGHCFCSACIRTNMASTSTPTCPLCRESVSEMQLRKNQVLEDAVKAWREARSFVLDLVRQDIIDRTLHSALSVQESSSLPSRASTPLLSTPRRKRKADASADEDIMIITPKKTKTRTEATAFSSGFAVVQCPACSKQVLEKDINVHLDRNCASSSTSKVDQKQQWNKLFIGAGNAGGSKSKGKTKASTPGPDVDGADPFIDPIPKVAYDVIGLKSLKAELRQYDLSDIGDRATLAARHQQWAILFNANRDASPAQRLSMKQLHDQMSRWEKDQDEREKKRREREKKQGGVDAAKHQEQYNAMFKQLADTARRTAKQVKTSLPKSAISQTAATPSPKVADIQEEDDVVLVEA